jgi:hypothetical protein
VVVFMRQTLGWDVLFVVEEDALRRARDIRHYQLARQLRRTLITLDRDYLDDRRFPPAESSGVLVLQAHDEQQFVQLLRRIDRLLFVAESGTTPLPLEGRTLQVHADWRLDE